MHPLLLDSIWHLALGPYSFLLHQQPGTEDFIQATFLATICTLPLWIPAWRRDWSRVALLAGLVSAPIWALWGLCWFGQKFT